MLLPNQKYKNTTLDTRVDILLGTYNGASFLSMQIESILNQSNTNWRLIVRDDGSTDRTIEILHNYQSQYPEKIILINNEYNLGVISNFSKLLESCSASYILFCDQDDIWLPEKIELTLKAMLNVEKSHPSTPILIHTDLKVVDADLTILSNSYWSYQGINPNYNTLNRLLVQNVITGCTVMINKKLADMASPFPGEVIMHDWWLGLIAASFGQINYINTPTILYRQHNNNDTGATSFNIHTAVNKMQNLSDFNLQKYTIQADLLLTRYEKYFSKQQIDLLTDFISTQKEPWMKAKFILLKHRIIKQGLLHNIGLFLCR